MYNYTDLYMPTTYVVNPELSEIWDYSRRSLLLHLKPVVQI